jgi:hypothetical protein
MRRLLTAAIVWVAAGLSWLAMPPRSAATSGGGGCAVSDFTLSCAAFGPGSVTPGRGGGVHCNFSRARLDYGFGGQVPIPVEGVPEDEQSTSPGSPLLYAWAMQCSDGRAGLRWFPRPSPGTVAQAVRDAQDTAARQPDGHVAPSPEFGQPGAITQMPMWFWESGSAFDDTLQAAASVPGIAVRAHANAVSLTFVAGDGGEVSCTTKGLTFAPGASIRSTPNDCAYTYRHAGTYHASVRVEWGVICDAGPCITEPPIRREADFDVTVVESQAVVS